VITTSAEHAALIIRTLHFSRSGCLRATRPADGKRGRLPSLCSLLNELIHILRISTNLNEFMIFKIYTPPWHHHPRLIVIVTVIVPQTARVPSRLRLWSASTKTFPSTRGGAIIVSVSALTPFARPSDLFFFHLSNFKFNNTIILASIDTRFLSCSSPQTTRARPIPAHGVPASANLTPFLDSTSGRQRSADHRKAVCLLSR